MSSSILTQAPTQERTQIRTGRGRRYVTLTFLRGAVAALSVTLLVGLLGVLYTVPAIGESLEEIGIQFTALRPLHTIFAAAWIFLGSIAVVHRYFEDVAAPMSPGDRLRIRIQLILWAIAGLGIFITVSLGIGSGREYMGFHPGFSVFILGGWLCFVWSFFRITRKGFWQKPVYITMWAVGCLFFIYTFCEQHAYLLPGVFSDPIVDKRIQWKACGTLVGSFNLFVYGSLIYIGEKTSGDKSYGNSKIAYSLFGIGLLNSFTNYAHHTYHLPQSHLVKWVAFIISMLEIIILFRVVWDIARSVSVKKRDQYDSMTHWINASKWWTGAMLFSSILISIPPLNALIHGTYVVTAHAMGTMIGIDSIILLGTLTFVLGEFLGKQRYLLHNTISKVTVIGLNLGTGALVVWLNFVGMADGYYRYFIPRSEVYHRPEWLGNIAAIGFAAFGIITFIFFALLVIRWIPLVSHPPNMGGGQQSKLANNLSDGGPDSEQAHCYS